MKNIEAKVQEFFANNPEADKVFSTSDEFLFDQEMYAIQHAATLTNKDVVKHTNRNTPANTAKMMADVEVATVSDAGAEIRSKKVTVEAPNAMDAPVEVLGKVDTVKEAVTAQVEQSVEAVNSNGLTEKPNLDAVENAANDVAITADKVEINKDTAPAKEVVKKVTTKTTTTEKAQK